LGSLSRKKMDHCAPGVVVLALALVSVVQEDSPDRRHHPQRRPPAATPTGAPSTGTTTRVSVASDGTQGNWGFWLPAISADGRYVAFHSAASNLVPGDTNVRYDVFVHDRGGQ